MQKTNDVSSMTKSLALRHLKDYVDGLGLVLDDKVLGLALESKVFKA